MTKKAIGILTVVTLSCVAACGSSPSASSGNDGADSGTGGAQSSSTTGTPGIGGNATTSGTGTGQGGSQTAGGTRTSGSTDGADAKGGVGGESDTTAGGTSPDATAQGGRGGTTDSVARGGQSATASQGSTSSSVARGGQSATAGQGGTGGQSGSTAAAWAPSAACVEKAKTLADSLTLAQKIGQMTQVDSGGLETSEVTAGYLGSVLSGGGTEPEGGNDKAVWSALISSYLNAAKSFDPHIGLLFGLDAVHGNNNVQDSVMFPHNIGLGATRNAKLVEEIGRITALEMLGVGSNWAFHPTVAAALDERWGRTYETFSETPDLASELGRATVVGLQNGTLSSKQSVLACAKHYAGDGASDNGENAGDSTSLDEAAFRKLALEPYRASIQAGVGSIMVSYGSYKGTKMTGAKKWLTDVLKGELGFKGFLVSDWNAVTQLSGDFSEQVKTAINAGIDMVMLSHDKYAHTAAELASTLSALVSSSDVASERVNDAVQRILTIKCEMGLLDGDTVIDPALTSAIGSAEHRVVARDAVRQSMVLLKNDGALPLPKTLTRIHVTGSGADSLAKQCGGWTVGWQGLTGAGAPAGTVVVGTTVLAAIKKKVEGGSTTITTSSDGSGAEGADRAVVVVGEAPYAEGYGDKTNPTLTTADFAAIAKVKAANVPFVVVLFSGRPLILADANGVSAVDQANAFIAAWLPGTEGDGIADVLFGDYKPTGKLSFSWPSSLSQIPINVGDGKTPLFPFGHGLTYP